MQLWAAQVRLLRLWTGIRIWRTLQHSIPTLFWSTSRLPSLHPETLPPYSIPPSCHPLLTIAIQLYKRPKVQALDLRVGLKSLKSKTEFVEPMIRSSLRQLHFNVWLFSSPCTLLSQLYSDSLPFLFSVAMHLMQLHMWWWAGGVVQRSEVPPCLKKQDWLSDGRLAHLLWRSYHSWQKDNVFVKLVWSIVAVACQRLGKCNGAMIMFVLWTETSGEIERSLRFLKE